MIATKIWVTLIYVALLCSSCLAYKPIFCLHGIHDSEKAWLAFKNVIHEDHPETPVIRLSSYDMTKSYLPLWHQAKGVIATIRTIIQQNDKLREKRTTELIDFSKGYHLVCHSQGALTCRAVIEIMDDHKIETFVSLAGPQMGIYGRFAHVWPKQAPHYIWHLAYSWIAQHTLSVANMWRDVMTIDSYQSYLKSQIFLPVLNNELESKFGDTEQTKRKANFCRLKNAHFFGSPDDDQIKPWQSTQFGFYQISKETIIPNEHWSQNRLKISPVEEQEVYIRDLFGLKTLNQRKGLHLHVVRNMTHDAWIHKSEFLQELVPLFD